MEGRRPHAVMVPCPTPGHIDPTLKLAKLLHHRGFYITFVLTDYVHHRLLLASSDAGEHPLPSLPDFRFESVSDGLPFSGREGIQHIKDLCFALRDIFSVNFRSLLTKLHHDPSVPTVTCVVGALMYFALQVAEEMGIPNVLFMTESACGFMGTLHCGDLIRRGYIPLKDEGHLTNGYMDTTIDWIPGMEGGFLRLRDLTSFIRTTDADDILLAFERNQAECGFGAWGVILNTFDELESDVIVALRRRFFPRLYTLGSLSLLVDDQIKEEFSPPKSIHLSLWKEDTECLEWLDSREPCSVVYVNFGSITVLTTQQLIEFAWGLANCGYQFLWVIRPDLVAGKEAVLPEEFVEETKGGCFLTSWCPQEQVLAHPAIGGFLTHGGWNSMLESICRGVPVICWPFFAEQPTNCRYACSVWGIGMEVEGDVERSRVEALARELMGGEKGRVKRENVRKWKGKAEEAAMEDGTSHKNMESLVHDLLQEARM